ncbi:PLP-dependent aminotransferase family protein [Clostridium sp. MSJ-4]|uniref:PLP-dependent aminotransferase family protein n=1 Tax=Clostridium simiarum TaxID=2841506 RepID=A0ABS6EX74_9CLOT|nr:MULTISPECIES: PLP-dependent aminotransferase family protein [Clostridium]MBU5590681.1 PLP-dependent aminotransferase family protein [Clostridium simiarum]
MNIKFSDRMGEIKASEIRELLKLTQQPEIISFAGGLPAPELFPIENMEKVASKVIREQGREALQYSTTEGFNPLREVIIEQRLKPVGINASLENIMITSGSQQALEFSAKLFINEGDVILCESPSYLGAINAFKAYKPTFVEIPMDDDGMIIEELEKALKEHKNTKFIYTIPDFQNPTGKTMTIERRKRLAEIGAEYQVPVIEDSPYGELIFDGEKYPTIKSFDKEGFVIQLGTYSKTFCPGLRIGWVCGHKDIIQKYVMIKQGADLQSSTLDQRIAAAYMKEYNLDEHIAKIIEVYKKRRDIMINSMKAYFPKEIKFTNSKGGLFTWVELKEGLDAAEILKEALEEKVAFVPGASFFPNGGHKNYFRLNYSNMPEEKIKEGIERLGKVLSKYY